MSSSVLKETTSNLERFDNILNEQNDGLVLNKEDRDFIEYFEFKLAESLLKELGTIATRTAEHILVSRKEV